MLAKIKGAFAILLLVGMGLIATMVYVSLTNGEFDITVKDIVRTLLRIDQNRDHDLVIFEFRLPRIVIAVLVGMGLGVAGAVIQGVTRNGLADPGMLGINAGAGVAIVIFLYFYQGQIREVTWLSVMAMPLFGLFGGLLAALLIYLFAWKHGRLEPQRLLLTGLAIASGLSAISLFLTLRMNSQDFEMVAVWTSGSIYNANWKYIVSILPWFAVLMPLIYARSHTLNLLQLDDDSVRSVGVRLERQKAILLLSGIGIVSACVSVAGGIGFIGLIAPHIAKRLVGSAHQRILPICAIVGALLVLTADFIGKTLFSPVELPAGIIVAILGVPSFVYLLYRRKGRM
ncbi:bacillibactin ABC transporter integral membrane protein [Cohnella sp. SGD-V74]|uniref:FecCD family ABC transporter permease n=1 Tax=unclassified Cohnella TaxID=2636738 RepID=UPI000D4918F5|nr:bacillibactin ABC transporter integral membrane protein [Cohnella sp. SGD-V74]